MNSTFGFIILVFALSGLIITPVTISESFAEKGGNNKSQGDPQGCDNGKGQDAGQNPNCDENGGTEPPETDVDGDGIPDNEDACPNVRVSHFIKSNPDHDSDGIPDFRDKTPCPVA